MARIITSKEMREEIIRRIASSTSMSAGDTMHSSDRTLLAKLGFADPDKKNPRHDWACQYLAQPGVLKKLFTNFIPLDTANEGHITHLGVDQLQPETHIFKGEGQYRTTIGFADLTGRLMVSLQQYGRLFPDCPVQAAVSNSEVEIDSEVKRCRAIYEAGTQRNMYEGPGLLYRKAQDAARVALTAKKADDYQAALRAWSDTPAAQTSKFMVRTSITDLLVEVKIIPVFVGDVLRQIKLYREYLPDVGQVFGGKSDDGGFCTCSSKPDNCSNPNCTSRQWSNWASINDTHQAQLLRQHAVLLVTDYAIDQVDLDTLKAEGVQHARLGAGFEAFVEKRKAQPPAKNNEV